MKKITEKTISRGIDEDYLLVCLRVSDENLLCKMICSVFADCENSDGPSHIEIVINSPSFNIFVHTWNKASHRRKFYYEEELEKLGIFKGKYELLWYDDGFEDLPLISLIGKDIQANFMKLMRLYGINIDEDEDS